jgi:DNA topoisomerase-1
MPSSSSSSSSSFKGKSDRDKYGKAIRLKSSIGKIRADYKKNLTKKDAKSKQIATAMWLIDILALRVGGEKGEDEADTGAINKLYHWA